jgi:Fe-S cluster assembly ATP-binding protein
MLEVKNLSFSYDEKLVLKNLNFNLDKVSHVVLIGESGCGKSTFSKILAGHPSYEVSGGSISFVGKNLLEMSPEIRSHEGLFLAFQYPIEIAGVTNYDFLRIAYNEKRKYLKEKELDPLEFMELTQFFLKQLKMKDEFLNRNLNEGFSGGEKKRNEVLQMLLLAPKLIILDEIDSGLDIDAIKIICEAIQQNLLQNSSLILITHYPRILKYLKPDFVHIMMDGKIIKSGNLELISDLEEEGYNQFSS